MLIISVLKSKNYDIDSRLESAKKELVLHKNNLEIDSKSQTKLKDQLNDCKQTQKDMVKAFEKDKKRYKLLKRYGEILMRIEKLYGLLPTNLDSLSLTELEEKLQELLKNRKRNELQMMFIFYQTLYTNSIKNLLAIEKDYQAGIISQKEARKSVLKIHNEIESEEAHVPKQLKDTHKEVEHLISIYEKSYSKEEDKKIDGDRSPLIETDFSVKHTILMEKLNANANQLINNIGNLSTELTNFEPMVNLDKLTQNMKETEDVVNVENFDTDRFERTLNNLEVTTNNLIDEQIEKNEIKENLSEQIKEQTESTKEINSSSMKEISTELFENASERATTSIETTDEIVAVLESNDNLPTEISNQIANTVIAQMESDLDFCDRVTSAPDAESSLFEQEKTEEALESAENLKELVDKKEQELNMVLTLEQEQELDEIENKIEEKKEENN